MIVRGSSARESSANTARKIRPHPRALGWSTIQSTAGTHFIHVARPQMRPAALGPTNCAPNSESASSRLMLPVSRFAAIGNARIVTRIAVGSGRREYAQRIDHRSSRIVAPRQTNQATSHGSRAQGTNSGSIHGA